MDIFGRLDELASIYDAFDREAAKQNAASPGSPRPSSCIRTGRVSWPPCPTSRHGSPAAGRPPMRRCPLTSGDGGAENRPRVTHRTRTPPRPVSGRPHPGCAGRCTPGRGGGGDFLGSLLASAEMHLALRWLAQTDPSGRRSP